MKKDNHSNQIVDKQFEQTCKIVNSWKVYSTTVAHKILTTTCTLKILVRQRLVRGLPKACHWFVTSQQCKVSQSIWLLSDQPVSVDGVTYLLTSQDCQRLVTLLASNLICIIKRLLYISLPCPPLFQNVCLVCHKVVKLTTLGLSACHKSETSL